MAGAKPVPSKAALHALRGILFTTSFSVALLAEERRRRTELARTAIDNARKLSSVKAKRRVPRVDSHQPDAGLQSTEQTQSTVPRRRRRTRNSSSIGSEHLSDNSTSKTYDNLTLREGTLGRDTEAIPGHCHASTQRRAVSTGSIFPTCSMLQWKNSTPQSPSLYPSTTPAVHVRYFNTSRSQPNLTRSTRPISRATTAKASPSNLGFGQHASTLASTDPSEFATVLSDTSFGRLVESNIEKMKNEADWDESVLCKSLTDLVSRTMRTYPRSEVDPVIRYLAKTYNLRLENSWKHFLLNQYSNLAEYHSMFSWLYFCIEQTRRHGYHIKQEFVAFFYNRCALHWNLSHSQVTDLYRVLRRADGGIRKPPPQPTINQKEKERLTDFYIRQSRLYLGEGNLPLSERDQFDRMEKAAKCGEWDVVWSAFDASKPFSVRCFRLAVLARLQLDNGSTHAAVRFLWSQKMPEHVSAALTPVLMAQLAEGQNPHGVIFEALNKGAKIHDVIYNQATKKACERGEAQAALDAIDICHVAARQNGQGDLLYNEFNFLNLVWAHVRLDQHSALSQLLSAYTSRHTSWTSNKRVKVALKFAMKTMAKRALSRNKESAYLGILEKLNAAHCYGGFANSLDSQHVKKVKESVIKLLPEAPSKVASNERSNQSVSQTDATKSILVDGVASQDMAAEAANSDLHHDVKSSGVVSSPQDQSAQPLRQGSHPPIDAALHVKDKDPIQNISPAVERQGPEHTDNSSALGLAKAKTGVHGPVQPQQFEMKTVGSSEPAESRMERSKPDSMDNSASASGVLQKPRPGQEPSASKTFVQRNPEDVHPVAQNSVEAEVVEYTASGSSEPLKARDMMDKLGCRGKSAFTPGVSTRRQQLLTRKRMMLSSTRPQNRFSEHVPLASEQEIRHRAVSSF